MWHCNLSHIGIKRMKKLHVDGSWDSLIFEKIETCEPCLLVYMHEETPCRWIVWTHLILNHLGHANHTTRARWLKSLVISKMEQESNLLEVIHFDVCSPMSVEARSGYRYVLTSRMIWVDTGYIIWWNTSLNYWMVQVISEWSWRSLWQEDKMSMIWS